MVSVYSSMDMNFAQSFPTPFGLARSRVGYFEPQETFRHQQETSSPSTCPSLNMVTSSVSLVEPMMQSTLTMMPTSATPTPSLSSSSQSSSSIPSNPIVYYDAYSPPYAHNITLPASTTTSPLMNDSWTYNTPTDLLSESTYNHSFNSPLPHQQDQEQRFMYTPNDSSFDLSQPRPEEHQSYSTCTSSHSPISNQVYDSVSSLLYSPGYHHSYQCNDESSRSGVDSISLNRTPTTHSPSTQQQQQQQLSNKRKREPSPPMMNKKTYRSPSMSSGSSCSDSMIYQTSYPHPPKQQRQQEPRQRYTLVDHRSSIYPTMNMISSFPTRINISTSKSPKRYVCQICSKKFTRPSSLTTHIYSHTGEKPFQCPMEGCGRHFSVVSNLRRHAKIHNLPSSPPKY